MDDTRIRGSVLVFTESVLSISETFIANHCRFLVRYDPVLVGVHALHNPNTVGFKSVVLEGNWIKSRLGRLFFRLGFSRQMDEVIREIRPSIIHAHYAVNGVFMLPYALRHKIPLVVTLHGYDVTKKLGKFSLYSWIYRFRRGQLARKAALILPASKYLEQRAISNGLAFSRSKVHYLGIPVDQSPIIDILKNKPKVIFAGRLVEKKGIDNVLAAFFLLLRELPHIELHIIGDGPLRSLVEKAVAESKSIFFYGSVTQNRVLSIMREGRVFVMPSRVAADGDAEGLGLVLLEAQSVGLPVITANNSGTREAMVNDESGILVDPNSVAELVQAMHTLLTDDQKLSSMSKFAYRWVREYFNIKDRSTILESFYDEILDDQSS